jgi:hypothetical protein
MKNFYQAMFEQGLTPAAALRSAKQSMRQSESWSAPYFWAGFVLHGEYNHRIEVPGYSRIKMTLLIVLVLSASTLLAFKLRRRSQVNLRARKGH